MSATATATTTTATAPQRGAKRAPQGAHYNAIRKTLKEVDGNLRVGRDALLTANTMIEYTFEKLMREASACTRNAKRVCLREDDVRAAVTLLLPMGMQSRALKRIKDSLHSLDKSKDQYKRDNANLPKNPARVKAMQAARVKALEASLARALKY